MKQLKIYKAPFTGRSREIKILRGILSDMKENGSGAFAVLHGEPGTGRTRILDEFAFACTSADDVLIRMSLSPSFRQKPYGTLWLLFDLYLKRIETYSERKKNELRKTVLRSIEKNASLFAEIHPGFVSFLLKKEPSAVSIPPDDNGRFAETAAKLFSNIGEFENGLIVVVDDAHFSDRATIELLRGNVHTLASMKCIFIGSYQDAPGRAVHSEYPSFFGTGKGHIVDIPVESFDRAAHVRYCAGLFDTDEAQAESVSAFIYGKTGGNPLMTREAALFLIRCGALTADNDMLVLDIEKASPLDAYGTYLPIALKNADYLDDAEKGILSLLAVLGMRFTDAWIGQFLPGYAGKEYSDTPVVIDKACFLNFIEKTNDEYRWPHAGVREYFYQTVDVHIRNALHLDIARFLEERIADNEGLLYEAAYHFMKSGDVQKAVPFALAAGERAMRMNAGASAADFFSFCLHAGKDSLDGDTEFRCMLGMAVIALNQGHYQDAVAQLKDLEPKAPSSQLYEVYKHLSFAYLKLGYFHTCEEISRKGLAMLGEHVPPGGFFAVCAAVLQIPVLIAAWLLPHPELVSDKLKRQQGKIYFWGTLIRGYAVSNIFLFMYAALRIRIIVGGGLRDTPDQATSDLIIAAILLSSGHFRQASRYLDGALAVRRAANDEWGIAQLQQMKGFLHIWRGDAAGAEASLVSARDVFTRIGDINELCTTLFHLSEMYRCLSRFREARAAAREGYERAHEARDEYSCAAASYNLSVIASETGDMEDAHYWSSLCAGSSEKTGNNFCEYLYNLSRAVIFSASGDYSSAGEFAERAFLISRRHYIPGYYTAALFLPAGIIASKGISIDGFGLFRRWVSARRSMKWGARKSEILYARGLMHAAKGRMRFAERFFSAAEKDAFAHGREGIAASIQCARAACVLRRGRTHEALDMYERSFFFYEGVGLIYESDRILSLMRSIVSGDIRIRHITAERRLSLMLKAQELALEGVPRLRSLLDLCMQYARAAEGALFLAGEDAVKLLPSAVSGNSERFSRLAKDVYISEMSIIEEGDFLIGIPVIRGTAVSGALCLYGPQVVSLTKDDTDIIAAVLLYALPGQGGTIPAEKVFQEHSAGIGAFEDTRIDTVITYIKENYRDDISREGLASLAGMHPDNLGKMFKLNTGKKIGDFINDLRIEEAMEALSSADMPIIDVAFSVGFESLRTFNRAFSTYAGLTPSEYRMSVRNRKEIW